MIEPEAAAPSAGRDTTRLAWSSIALLAAVQFAAYVDRALPAVVAPLLKAELGLSDASVGALQGPAFVALYVVGLLAASHWLRGVDPWRVALACLVAWSAGGVLFALAPSYEWLIAGRVLLGAGQAAFAPAALALLGGQSDPGRRARALSLFTTGSSTGRSGALLLGGAALLGLASGAAGLTGWRAASLALTLPNVVLACLLVLAARSRRSQGFEIRNEGLGAALSAVRRRPAAFLSMAGVGAACVCVVQAAGAWAPSLLHRRFDFTAGESALAFGAIVILFAPVGHLGAGWLMARSAARSSGPAPFTAGAIALAAVCAAALPFAGRSQALSLIAGLTAAGGLAVASTLIGLQNMTEPRLRPAMGALFLAVVSVAGTGGGPWLTGLVSDMLLQGGWTSPLSAAMAAVIVSGALVAVLLAWFAGGLWRRPLEVPGRRLD